MTKQNLLFLTTFVLLVASLTVLFLRDRSDLLPAASAPDEPLEVTLEFWGLWDSSDSWQPIIDKFEAEEHDWNGRKVKVKVNYSKKEIGSYEADWRKAADAGRSPSLFMISNYWLERYQAELAPLSRNAAYIEEYGLIDYEQLTATYPTGVLRDAMGQDGELYAAPVYSDSLALYYNKELFARAGIATPPATWDELKADVKKLTLLGKQDAIKQSGAALGAGKNISRSCDLVAVLAMQGGGKVIDETGVFDLNQTVNVKTSEGSAERQPGLTAIQFYMEFSDPRKEIYAWNDSFENSLTDFAAGRTAMMIGYAYQKENLLALKPDLDYAIAPLPQIPDSAAINFSNFWMPVVSNQASCTVNGRGNTAVDCGKIAWSFLSYASRSENVASYLAATGKAAARLDLLAEQAGRDDKTSAFARQAASARGYGKFDDRIDNILTEMLDRIYADRSNWKTHVDEAGERIAALKAN